MKMKSFPIVIGKIQISPIIQEMGYACLNYSGLKSPMGAIIGKSGSGKTYSLASLVFSTFANSVIQEKNQKLSIVDPHNGSIPRIQSLIGKFYASEPKHTRYSSVAIYSHPEGGKFGYDPNTGSVMKAFVFNPLVPFSDGHGGYVPSELQVEWFLASLQGVFAVTDFGPRNLLSVGTIARMFIAFNVAIIEGKIVGKPFYTLKDLAEFFLDMSNTQTLPNYINTELPLIDPKTSANIRPSLKKMVQNVKTDKSYFDSANTKLGMFLLVSNEAVFGVGVGPEKIKMLFDVGSSFLKPQTETSIEMFDLSKFGEEKNMIASCITNAAYFFGKRRPVPAISEHLLIVDEFQSLISLRTNTLYFTVQNILFQSRKYGVGIVPVFQEITDELRSIISNFGFILVFALRQDAAEKIIADLNAGISGNFELLPEHISNLEQGQFVGRFDTKNSGVLTVIAKSINFSIPSEISAILSLGNNHT